MSKVIGVILAGGSGDRFGAVKPKQFTDVFGRTVIEYTVDAFEQNEGIEEIVIVTRADYISWVNEIVHKNKWRKVRHVVPGGKERYHSTLAAVDLYSDEDKLIIHDAVRPLVSQRIIDDCIAALDKYNAVDVAVKAVDTIIQVDENECICGVPYRPMLRNGQTPQCFRRATIRRAYEIALQDPGFKTTDDCGVVFKYLPDEPVYVVEGEYRNLKLTNPEDLVILKHYLGER
ncbi:MAG: 2-C-methyl-D-erythritol 4-phosphate cytidylyltransferase [Bacteroidales bacterium]|nr:2-C-methyl-D-erythritol 4-phosphate cytidylyltransferase [Bacteroidales bacterium]